MEHENGESWWVYAIHHMDREYARETGDQVLARVFARDKAEAEHKASHLGIYAPSGFWAVRIDRIPPRSVPGN